MITRKLNTYLEEHDISYVSIQHPISFTAEGIARAAHISGKMMAKTVILKVDNDWVMTVMPSNKKVNFSKIKELLSAKVVELVSEETLQDIFSDCEIGAMPQCH